MAIIKRTMIDTVEIQMNGFVGVRFLLALEEDSVILSYTYHRTVVPPGHDPMLYINAVNECLAMDGRGFPSIETERIVEVQEICTLAHTEARITAYNASIAEQLARWQPP